MSCDDISIDQFLLLFSSRSMRLFVFHLEYHCTVLWLIRLTNCLKMDWSLRPKSHAIEKIHGLVEKLNKLYFLTPYWYFKWFNTDLSNYNIIMTIQIVIYWNISLLEEAAFIALYWNVKMERSLYWYIGSLSILNNTYTTALITKQGARKVSFPP